MLRQASTTLNLSGPRQGLHEITDEIDSWVRDQDFGTGLLTIFCRHTSASLLIQENAASAARRDLETYFSRIAPEDPALYTHNDEGPDDMSAHIRTVLTNPDLTVPVSNGKCALGIWQGIYLCEFDGPRERKIIVTVL